MSDKKIPSIASCDTAWVETMPENQEKYLKGEDVEILLKEVVKYTLEQAVENVKTFDDGYFDLEGSWHSDNRIDQQSILSLEEQIIKELKL